MAESNVSLEIIEIQKSESAVWDTLVDSSPQGTFFHTTTWADIISRIFSRSYNIILCMKNEQPVGGMIFFSQKKMLWKMITPTAFFPYCAPIFYHPVDEKPQKTIHNHLNITTQIENYLRNNYDYWILDLPWKSNDVRSYIWKGASVEPRYSYLVSLKKKEEIFINFNQSIRKKIKQAENQKAVIKESTDTKILVDLISNSYHRHGMTPIVSVDKLKTFLSTVITLDEVKLFYLEVNGKITAGRLIIVDKLTAYDLLAGSEDQTGFGSAYLVASILKKIAGAVEYFDFLGADHPKIEQFKRGFGGELTQGFRITNKTKIPLSWIIRVYRNYLYKERVL
jgi:hypothetical protein